ncbi:kinase-like protein [Trichodelitschia bisporula]|uniref:mitogen-activated protein kinase kinase n=1 Tax=Trichodelitschia bisporula TaxID=703511 RepID=A0A6G1HKP9_9PEZI|nr:kinase-like protein [Trichodelitschia bisporula]
MSSSPAPSTPTPTSPISPPNVSSLQPPHPPLSPRSVSESTATTAGMTTSSTPLGNIMAARRPSNQSTFASSRGEPVSRQSSELLARVSAWRLSRQGPPQHPARLASDLPAHGPTGGITSPTSPSGPGSMPGSLSLQLPNGAPALKNLHSAPAVPNMRLGRNKPSLAEKRGLALPGGLPGATPNGTPVPVGRKKPGLSLSQMQGGGENKDQEPQKNGGTGGTMMDKYADYLDAKTGSLRFAGKAVLNSQGVQFTNGTSFSISLDEVDTMDELGKGNYGTVYKVRHSRPKIRRPGMGLAGNRPQFGHTPSGPVRKASGDGDDSQSPKSEGTTGAIMAMKEIRLELDDAKFAAIIMELDVLHRCISPYIVDFYGAFFQEGAVYICMEFMDGGSIDKLYGDGIPENVLRKITYATTMGLKCLKEDHNIIHRDVKPTNILMNTRGQIKICDFGVSGNLVASFAKTNIGCQSYMAPERISTGGMGGASFGDGTYSVQSDIWSLGLTIIECALGRYPYPPETYNNIFSQLSAIVDGEPPDLPVGSFSEPARHFVRSCLNKTPKLRPTYPMLLLHPWLTSLAKPSAIVEEDEDEEVTPEPGSESDENESPALPTADSEAQPITRNPLLPHNVVDAEVAEWVIEAIEKRRSGRLARSEKPALHAAPLDAVVSPKLVECE